MFDYVDEIVAALVLGIAASYVVREFMGWRSAKPQRDIENLNAQGRHILTIISDEKNNFLPGQAVVQGVAEDTGGISG